MTGYAARAEHATIHARGGETHVAVYTVPEGMNPKMREAHVMIAHAVAACNNKHENFRNDLGTAVALGRVLQKLHAAGVAREVRV